MSSEEQAQELAAPRTTQAGDAAPASQPPPLRIVSVDANLYNADGVYEFSPERVAAAKLRCFEQIRSFVEAAGSAARVVAMCGHCGVGKSAWLEHHGASLGSGAVFFDDQLYNGTKRSLFLKGLEEHGIVAPVDIVVIERDFDRAMASVQRRPPWHHRIPIEALQRYRHQYVRPAADEGFERLLVLVNDYDDETGEGGYSVVSDTSAEPSA